MSTIEDFKNAPVWATATSADGIRIMKMDDDKWGWGSRMVPYLSDEEMANEGFTLEPPVPTSAREALDLTWELAHPVKEGQVIPKGTRFMEFHSSGVREYTAMRDLTVSPGLVLIIRTLEPLTDPEPDWLDAPAVMARLKTWIPEGDLIVFTRYTHDHGYWLAIDPPAHHWSELVDVTPLYPKEDA